MSALGTGLFSVGKGTLIAFRSASSAFTTSVAKNRDLGRISCRCAQSSFGCYAIRQERPVALSCLIYYVELILLLHILHSPFILPSYMQELKAFHFWGRGKEEEERRGKREGQNKDHAHL